ncbi:enoyl-CoA hydratase/isomerase family protein [Jannaschia rubra]|uniref:3-hydroxyisobutyryl-CoA hydrolase n=1 Tax=Jannaschia rubra TaxID=282197 RepID=A0A0M6XR49_9RHOB|nr:enoyl-CoA hydratase/isomerase family protein [Jannaschia rubra]CTQ33097.1 Carnitinyl-CoA dehydratase [Jannaschia rubra]SFG74120.1 enoyl-CoA hydratase [Jannaschia rubra]
MSDDIHIRVEGRAGRITLDRPDVLNALSWDMCLRIEKALDDWRLQDDVQVILIDAVPGRAFCAGGDIIAMHEAGIEGRYDYGRRFWADEYRLNAKLFHFPKPVITFLHGFTMGGGVGLGCHGSHRIVRDDSRIAMPECAIGLAPDVGGTFILANAPGLLGEYLGVTGARMGPGDAIRAGFADHYVPEEWGDLKDALVETGDVAAVEAAALAPPEAALAGMQAEIDALFAHDTLADVAAALDGREGSAADTLRQALSQNAPLSMACTVEILRRLRDDPTIERALGLEARFTFRAMEHGDFIEGIRARIIDKDGAPRWKHASAADVSRMDVENMLRPLGPLAPDLEVWT